jgi:hypothetical protein
MSMLTENTISATYCKVNLKKIQLSVQQSYLRTNVPQHTTYVFFVAAYCRLLMTTLIRRMAVTDE